MFCLRRTYKISRHILLNNGWCAHLKTVFPARSHMPSSVAILLRQRWCVIGYHCRKMTCVSTHIKCEQFLVARQARWHSHPDCVSRETSGWRFPAWCIEISASSYSQVLVVCIESWRLTLTGWYICIYRKQDVCMPVFWILNSLAGFWVNCLFFRWQLWPFQLCLGV